MPRCLIALFLILGAIVAGGRVAAQQPRSLSSGVYTEAQALRGELLYGENCAFCHAADLSGTLSGPVITVVALTARWGNRPLGDLAAFIQLFMPWNSPNGLSPQQNADILAYMLKRDHLPAGKLELPAEGDAQNEITVRVDR